MENRIKELFNKLNNGCEYLILRNWEDIYNESLYGPGLEYIDILCRSKNEFVELTGAKRVNKDKHRDNYYIDCGSLIVRFDIRWVGDNYYPREWEECMLSHRVYNSDGVFVLSPEDYCYASAYHALFQKKEISGKYLAIINNPISELRRSNDSMNGTMMLEELRSFMRSRSYRYVIPQDPAVYVNWKNVARVDHKYQMRFQVRRFLYRIKVRLAKY